MKLRPFRVLTMPDDCTGRIRYVRRTLWVSSITSIVMLLTMHSLPMGYALNFAAASTFVWSTLAFCIEFSRGNWRAGSFCHRETVHTYWRDDYEGRRGALKLRCGICGRMELR